MSCDNGVMISIVKKEYSEKRREISNAATTLQSWGHSRLRIAITSWPKRICPIVYKVWIQMADISNALNFVRFSIAFVLLRRATGEVLIMMPLYVLLPRARIINERHAYKCNCSSVGVLSSPPVVVASLDVWYISTANSVR